MCHTHDIRIESWDTQVEGLFVLANGMAKQWYKVHVSSCHDSWVNLKDQYCFTFFSLSKIIDLHNKVLNFAQKEGESLGAAWSRYNELALSGPISQPYQQRKNCFNSLHRD
jgi:hypothetical protein